MHSHRYLFVTGLHRGGTSLLYRCLRRHPEISGFHDTGVPEDEGQHLQTVLPRGGAYGGPGRFAKHPDAHMTEAHPLAVPATAAALFAQWSPYWNLNKPWLAEKTPITLTRTRLFQALFPDAHFVVLVRHPIAVTLATYNALASGGRVPDLTLTHLLENWLAGYETFRQDSPHLKNAAVVKYEEFADDPQRTLDAVYARLGLDSAPCGENIERRVNAAYLAQWRAMSKDAQYRSDIEQAMHLEGRFSSYGYSLLDAAGLSSESPGVGQAGSYEDPVAVIETERLILRRMTFGDINALAALCADPEVMRFWDGPMPREQVWGEIEDYLQEVERDGHSFFAVIHKADNVLIGQCGLRNREVDGKPETELGYMIARRYWGKGLATEAARATREYAFERLGLSRVVSVVDTRNIASQRVAKKNGLHVEKRISADGNEYSLFACETPSPVMPT